MVKELPLSGKKLGLTLAGVGMFLISTDSLLTRIADTDGWTVAFFVGFWSIPVTWALAFYNFRSQLITKLTEYRWPLLTTATLSALGTTSFIQAITRTEVANVVAIIAAAPVFAALFSRLIIGERTSGRTWRAIFLTVGGIFIIVSGSLNGGGLIGDSLAVFSILVFSINLVIWRRYLTMPRSLVIASSSVCIVIFTAFPAQPFTINGRSFIATLAMGLFFGPLARLCMTTAARYAPAAEVSLFTPVETVFASLWVWLWFGEVPAVATFIGGSVVIIAVTYGITGQIRELKQVINSQDINPIDNEPEVHT
tara:strand:+ start:380 stop:1309 length:930 start_codon:yes stop_codon:yes gene_type:complete